MKLAILLIAALLFGTFECASACASVEKCGSSCHHTKDAQPTCTHELVMHRAPAPVPAPSLVATGHAELPAPQSLATIHEIVIQSVLSCAPASTPPLRI